MGAAGEFKLLEACETVSATVVSDCRQLWPQCERHGANAAQRERASDSAGDPVTAISARGISSAACHSPTSMSLAMYLTDDDDDDVAASIPRGTRPTTSDITGIGPIHPLPTFWGPPQPGPS